MLTGAVSDEEAKKRYPDGWKQPLPYRSFGNPLVSGDRVFIGIGTGRLSEDLNSEVEPGVPPEREAGGAILALSAATGETVWRHDLPRSVHTQIVADATMTRMRSGISLGQRST